MIGDIWSSIEYISFRPSSDRNLEYYPIDEIKQKLSLVDKIIGGSDRYSLLHAAAAFLHDVISHGDGEKEIVLSSLASSVVITDDVAGTYENIKNMVLQYVRNNKTDFQVNENTTISKEIIKLANGHSLCTSFIGCLLNTLADILNIVIIVIPLCFELPLLPVLPSHGAASQYPMYLLFHYEDWSFTLCVDNNIGNKSVCCSCGKNDKVAKTRCSGDKRCKCRQRNISCGALCTCKKGLCQNFRNSGTKPRVRRIRTPCQLSSGLITPNSLTSAIASGDIGNIESLSSYQHFFLEALFYIYRQTKEKNKSSVDKDEKLLQNLEDIAKELEVISLMVLKEFRRHDVPLPSEFNREDILKWLEKREQCEVLMTQRMSNNKDNVSS